MEKVVYSRLDLYFTPYQNKFQPNDELYVLDENISECQSMKERKF